MTLGRPRYPRHNTSIRKTSLPTVIAAGGSKIITDMAKIYRIRKLTPREAFRLMGLRDDEIDKIQSYPFHELVKHPSYSKEEIYAGMTEEEKRSKMKDRISESQQYKLAGNSIVVDTLLHGIYINLFLKDGIPEGQLF